MAAPPNAAPPSAARSGARSIRPRIQSRLCSSGAANVTLPRRRLVGLGALVLGAAVVLCRDVRVVSGVAAVMLVYAAALPALYRARQRRKYFLVISMVANLGILGFFKYCDFFIG